MLSGRPGDLAAQGRGSRRRGDYRLRLYRSVDGAALRGGGCQGCRLEAVEVGFGGAGRNVGLVNAGMWLAPDDVATRLGPDYGERLLKLLGDGPSEVEALVTGMG